jgi:hypothetical protein
MLLTVCSFIEPAFSWSHLSITEPAFRKVLAGLQVFTPFLHVVHAFGTKTNDKQRANDFAYHHVQLSPAYGLLIFLYPPWRYVDLSMGRVLL